MKKLFTYLMTLGIISISTITIVSCGCSYSKQNKLEEEKQRKDSDVNSSLPINDNNPKKEGKTLQFRIDISGITKIKPIKKVNVKNIKDVQFSEWLEPIRDAILETLHEELSIKLTKDDYDVTPIIPKEFYIKGNIIDTLPFDLTLPRKIEITCLGKNNAKGRFNIYIILPKSTVK